MDVNLTLAEITKENYRTATIFRKYGLDFCCGGKRTLEQACIENNISIELLVSDLEKSLVDAIPIEDYANWGIELLTEYIVNFQHKYVKKSIPPIIDFLSKSCLQQSNKHQELIKIQLYFNQFSLLLLSHMQREEQVLFPYVNELCYFVKKNEKFHKPDFGTIFFQIEQLEQEHFKSGQIFKAIQSLSNNFSVPADASETYKTAYSLLNEFEENLHLHIHLENNILFPKVILVEEELRNEFT